MPTLLDLVLFSYFKGVFTELKRKIIGYRNYCKLVEDMDTKYLNATEEELIIYNDDCAICRDRMDTAKKLPCGHIFHHSCLRSWLEQQTSCPTCRRSLIELQNETGQPNNSNSNSNSNNAYVVNPSDIERIHELFPHIPRQSIINDLMQTHDINETTNNILESRIIIEPHSTEDDDNNNNNNNNNTNDIVNDNCTPIVNNNNNSIGSSSGNNPSLSSLSSSSSSPQTGQQPLPNDNINGNGVSHTSSISGDMNHVNNINIQTTTTTTVADVEDKSTTSNTTTPNTNITSPISPSPLEPQNQCTDNTNNNNSNNDNNYITRKLDKFSDSFQGTPEARQNSLLLRKRLMLEASRKKFLEDMDKASSNTSENTT
ncbi:putative ubiquitin-protein ligase [Cavenderia fasciculata]|uniref:Ubiquitin-protein ligase n=1 Tax=Cavenderia fasciculata TaxID=261658 RepID=F4PQH2_CACFS|nr:putative ubiquitin-protein ligase [Cavenderia fasciculata]EGG22635.1 putative ubiquitin-protein ligase [Cavenderia fasciculata]|eukprot:XP_004360486.1 putative ubiquitin-protein ligase [Cavenderia fasciculata]